MRAAKKVLEAVKKRRAELFPKKEKRLVRMGLEVDMTNRIEATRKQYLGGKV